MYAFTAAKADLDRGRLTKQAMRIPNLELKNAKVLVVSENPRSAQGVIQPSENCHLL
jgi:hypothetical protein